MWTNVLNKSEKGQFLGCMLLHLFDILDKELINGETLSQEKKLWITNMMNPPQNDTLDKMYRIDELYHNIFEEVWNIFEKHEDWTQWILRNRRFGFSDGKLNIYDKTLAEKYKISYVYNTEEVQSKKVSIVRLYNGIHIENINAYYVCHDINTQRHIQRNNGYNIYYDMGNKFKNALVNVDGLEYMLIYGKKDGKLVDVPLNINTILYMTK